MNTLQLSAAFNSFLKIAGSVATVLAIVNPQWGATLQLVIGALGTIGVSIGTIRATFSAPARAASGLTGAEAADVLNRASLAKATGTKIVGVLLALFLLPAFLYGCAGSTAITDSPPVVKADTDAIVLDVRLTERGIIDVAKETAKAALALLKPITSIADLPIGF